MKYRLNNNKELVNFIKSRLIDNDGYCPSIVGSVGMEQFKCPCKDFEENVGKGELCRCGLYIKVKK